VSALFFKKNKTFGLPDPASSARNVARGTASKARTKQNFRFIVTLAGVCVNEAW
jgi:hypothetical protein